MHDTIWVEYGAGTSVLWSLFKIFVWPRLSQFRRFGCGAILRPPKSAVDAFCSPKADAIMPTNLMAVGNSAPLMTAPLINIG